jgi:cysteine desulfurase
MHGPKGIGALYLRHGIGYSPLIRGGRQERGRRAGTENTPAIVGFGVAADLATQSLQGEMPRVAELRDLLRRELLLRIPGAMAIGDECNLLPNTLNVAFAEVEADSVLLRLDREGIAASSGSACSTGSMEPSHVLRAMKVPFTHLRGSIRFSLSRESCEEEIRQVVSVLPGIIAELTAKSMPAEVVLD